MALAAAASGLFAGSALYASVVESRAVLSHPSDGARAQFVRQFRPAGAFQAPLVLLATASGVTASLMSRDGLTIAAAAVMAIVVAVTAVVIFPLNARLLRAESAEGVDGRALLVRWYRLHAVRGAFALAANVLFLVALAQ